MAILVGILCGLTAVLVGFFAVLFYTKKKTEKINASGGCPVCRADVPAFRTPTSVRQALWGGWTCENCGTELNRQGAELSSAME
jgi:hypothetical protein